MIGLIQTEGAAEMHEVLFRGKRIDTGEWVYGYYYEEIGSFIKERPSAVSTATHLIRADTIGQYTGLRDKTGAMIFEGDILKFGDRHLLVWWNGEAFQWQAKATTSVPFVTYHSDWEYLPAWDNIDLGNIAAEIAVTGEISTEIIGNLFDHPSLLPGSHTEDEKEAHI